MFTLSLMLFFYRKTTLSGGPLSTMQHMKEKLKKRNNRTLKSMQLTIQISFIHEAQRTFYAG
jgi:hypothetical protein